MKIIFKYSYGMALCILIGICALLIADYIPLGSVAVAIVLGILVGNMTKPGENFSAGISFCERHVLSFAVALMGVNLDFVILNSLGVKSIGLIITAITITILSAVILAKLMKINIKRGLLIGIGNGVCGTSAIAATQSIIGADEEDVGLSIAIVNFLGTIGMIVLPIIGSIILKMTDINAGIFIGNTLQAVGQVTAGGFSISEVAGQTAMVVKMGRILMLTPIVLILIVLYAKNSSLGYRQGSDKRTPGIPLFIVGFVGFSILASLGIIPNSIVNILSRMSHYALIVSMAAIGLKITFAAILRGGKSALFIGALVFSIQIAYSFGVIHFLF